MNNYRKDLENAFKIKVEEKQKQVVAQTGLTVHAALVQTTPRDTGRAQANWHLDVNRVDTAIVDEGFDNRGEANKRIASYKLSDTVFVSNHLPYITRLDEGYSGQAPNGMVDAALQIGKQRAKELAKR